MHVTRTAALAWRGRPHPAATARAALTATLGVARAALPTHRHTPRPTGPGIGCTRCAATWTDHGWARPC